MEHANDTVTGHCHCGAVTFSALLSGGLERAMRCTCSLCRMRGAVVVVARMEDFTVEQGDDNLAEYRFNTGAARHYFCKTCGVYTHHQRRFDRSQYAINAACLEGVSPFDFAAVPVMDGVNHPLDGDGVFRIAGTLHFEAAAKTE